MNFLRVMSQSNSNLSHYCRRLTLLILDKYPVLKHHSALFFFLLPSLISLFTSLLSSFLFLSSRTELQYINVLFPPLFSLHGVTVFLNLHIAANIPWERQQLSSLLSCGSLGCKARLLPKAGCDTAITMLILFYSYNLRLESSSPLSFLQRR